ncbi:ribonuclease P protein component, partial [Bacillus pumilus]|uniref:ribonuclease P protein component n=1 Tax=Bacillus pumilus TaxID=1408 RepID=UPI003F68B9E9
MLNQLSLFIPVQQNINNPNTLKKNQHFQKLFKKRQSIPNRQFLIYHLHQPNQHELPLGFSVSKKIPNALIRNRI